MNVIETQFDNIHKNIFSLAKENNDIRSNAICSVTNNTHNNKNDID